MAKQSLRCVPQTGTVGQLVSDGYSELLSLREEAEEIVGNAPEGLADSERIQTFSSTVDSLSYADNEPDVPGCVADLPVNYVVDQRKSKSTSRASRCGEAGDLLEQAIGKIDEWLADDANAAHEDRDDVESMRDDVQNMIDSAQGADWPGMYG